MTPEGTLVTDAHNAALADRCEVCNSELSQCGTQGVDGEPSMDCLVCKLRDQLASEREKLKPLVDALKEIRIGAPPMVQRKIDDAIADADALAKVKEGK